MSNFPGKHQHMRIIIHLVVVCYQLFYLREVQNIKVLVRHLDLFLCI